MEFSEGMERFMEGTSENGEGASLGGEEDEFFERFCGREGERREGGVVAETEASERRRNGSKRRIG